MESSQCLICQTLGMTPSPGVSTKESKEPRGRSAKRNQNPPVARPDLVYDPPRAPAGRSRSLGWHVGLVIAAVLAIGIGVWLIAGIVLALLHVVELVAVALAAGWAGYRIGKHRGAKPHR